MQAGVPQWAWTTRLPYKTYRAEYKGDEGSPPYPGLVQFLDVRFERDFSFGEPEENELLRQHGYVGRLLTPAF
ncbi:MAG: hypothetical protein ABSH33_22455 [Steroidobacteraceae bacterium]|jgi:hypothetical protein